MAKGYGGCDVGTMTQKGDKPALPLKQPESQTRGDSGKDGGGRRKAGAAGGNKGGK